jgi:hypothetical protein
MKNFLLLSVLCAASIIDVFFAETASAQPTSQQSCTLTCKQSMFLGVRFTEWPSTCPQDHVCVRTSKGCDCECSSDPAHKQCLGKTCAGECKKMLRASDGSLDYAEMLAEDQIKKEKEIQQKAE